MTALIRAARLTLSFSKATASFLLCLSLTMLVVFAQAPIGSLRERVGDVNGAALPGATIMITDLSRVGVFRSGGQFHRQP